MTPFSKNGLELIIGDHKAAASRHYENSPLRSQSPECFGSLDFKGKSLQHIFAEAACKDQRTKPAGLLTGTLCIIASHIKSVPFLAPFSLLNFMGCATELNT